MTRPALLFVLALVACRGSDSDGTVDTDGTTGSADDTDGPADSSTGEPADSGSDSDTDADSDTDTDTDTDGGLLGVGEPCEDATQCQPELVCVYESATSDVRVCTDPLDGIYDDGSRDQVEPAGAWGRVRVADWEALGAVCNDGSPYAFYVSPGSGAGADDWLVFLKGGGACFDDESCARRWVQQPFFMRQQRTVVPDWSPGTTEGEQAGLFARDHADNHFADWNFVYLLYCSSDEFAGTRPAADHETNFHFAGEANVMATIDHLIAGIDASALGVTVPSLADADEVVVAGGSAGASGARRHMDRIADRIREAAPAARVRGFADSLVVPAVHPSNYDTEPTTHAFWGAVSDADCEEAHPETHAILCSDSLHLIQGHGRGDYLGEADSGHLGVPASTESYAVEGHFEFMAQFDGKLAPLGKIGMCIPIDECGSDAECAPGQGCLVGTCIDVQPCTPLLCTPDDVPCHGVGSEPTCFFEAGTHANVCDEGDDSTCDAGEVCLRGFCMQDGYTGCEADSECPEGFACDRRVCSAGIPEDECTLPGYYFESDTQTCDQIIGCGEANPCGEGYVCLPGNAGPIAQALSWGIREGLRGLGPDVGTYAPDSNTHTATIGAKYYGHLMPLVDGYTHAQAVDHWLADPATYDERISLPDELPLLLWTEDVVALTAGNLTETTTGSGCVDDAVAFLVCEVGPACSPANALAGFSVGDGGTLSVDGITPPGPVQLQLSVVPNPGCGGATVTPAPGAWLDLEHVVPASGATHTRKVAIPPVPLGDMPLTVYIGADGALYAESTLETLIVGRRE